MLNIGAELLLLSGKVHCGPCQVTQLSSKVWSPFGVATRQQTTYTGLDGGMPDTNVARQLGRQSSLWSCLLGRREDVQLLRERFAATQNLQNYVQFCYLALHATCGLCINTEGLFTIFNKL